MVARAASRGRVDLRSCSVTRVGWFAAGSIGEDFELCVPLSLVSATPNLGYWMFSIARIESTIVSTSLYAETQIVTGA